LRPLSPGYPVQQRAIQGQADKNPERYRVKATPGHIVQVIEPSGSTTVTMSEQDFEGYKGDDRAS
jgi:hypothetical protein